MYEGIYLFFIFSPPDFLKRVDFVQKNMGNGEKIQMEAVFAICFIIQEMSECPVQNNAIKFQRLRYSLGEG